MACMADNYAKKNQFYSLDNMVVSAESMFSYKSNSNYNRFSGGLYARRKTSYDLNTNNYARY